MIGTARAESRYRHFQNGFERHQKSELSYVSPKKLYVKGQFVSGCIIMGYVTIQLFLSK